MIKLYLCFIVNLKGRCQKLAFHFSLSFIDVIINLLYLPLLALFHTSQCITYSGLSTSHRNSLFILRRESLSHHDDFLYRLPVLLLQNIHIKCNLEVSHIRLTGLKTRSCRQCSGLKDNESEIVTRNLRTKVLLLYTRRQTGRRTT